MSILEYFGIHRNETDALYALLKRAERRSVDGQKLAAQVAAIDPRYTYLAFIWLAPTSAFSGDEREHDSICRFSEGKLVPFTPPAFEKQLARSLVEYFKRPPTGDSKERQPRVTRLEEAVGSRLVPHLIHHLCDAIVNDQCTMRNDEAAQIEVCASILARRQEQAIGALISQGCPTIAKHPRLADLRREPQPSLIKLGHLLSSVAKQSAQITLLERLLVERCIWLLQTVGVANTIAFLEAVGCAAIPSLLRVFHFAKSMDERTYAGFIGSEYTTTFEEGKLLPQIFIAPYYILSAFDSMGARGKLIAFAYLEGGDSRYSDAYRRLPSDDREQALAMLWEKYRYRVPEHCFWTRVRELLSEEELRTLGIASQTAIDLFKTPLNTQNRLIDEWEFCYAVEWFSRFYRGVILGKDERARIERRLRDAVVWSDDVEALLDLWGTTLGIVPVDWKRRVFWRYKDSVLEEVPILSLRRS